MSWGECGTPHANSGGSFPTDAQEWVTFESESPGPWGSSPVRHADTEPGQPGDAMQGLRAQRLDSDRASPHPQPGLPAALLRPDSHGCCTQMADPGHGVSGHSTPRPPGATRYPGAGTGLGGTDGLRVGLKGGHRRDLLRSWPLPQEAGVRSGSHETDGIREASASVCPVGSGRRGPEAGLAPWAAVKQLLRRIHHKRAPKRHCKLADKASFQIIEDLLGRDFVMCVCLDTLK